MIEKPLTYANGYGIEIVVHIAINITASIIGSTMCVIATKTMERMIGMTVIVAKLA